MSDIQPIIKKILAGRGIINEDEILEFLSPKPVKTYDPFLLHNMKEGVDLIMENINADKRICIYGDYDTDGITSICILKTVLNQLTDKVDYYIPLRDKEGYGLNKTAIEKIKEKGTDLLITVDCGSVSYDEVEYAKEIGLDILVTDHHSIDSVQADCLMINPKKPQCNYPFKGLAGCGVAYKLAQAIQRTADLPKSVINRLLDIVAIGTIGDIVPLVDENRTLSKYGLYELNRGNRSSVKSFAEGISLHMGSIGSDEISFGIVPHLNAAGRMDNANIGVKLLLSEDKNEINLLTTILKGYNNKRKEIQQETYELCLELMEEQCKDSLFPIIEAQNAHEGITGIVAGKIKDKIGKPVVIVTPCNEGKELKGTGRCVDNIDLYKVLNAHNDLFLRFGGHKSACGFSMKKENLSKLREAVNEEIKKIPEKDRISEIKVEMQISAKDVTIDLAEQLEQLAPFGNCNPKPLFLFRGMVPDRIKYLGVKANHVRFEGIMDNHRVTCILFGRAQDYKERLNENKKIDVYGEININQWNGKKNVQIFVKEIKNSN